MKPNFIASCRFHVFMLVFVRYVLCTGIYTYTKHEDMIRVYKEKYEEAVQDYVSHQFAITYTDAATCASNNCIATKLASEYVKYIDRAFEIFDKVTKPSDAAMRQFEFINEEQHIMDKKHYHEIEDFSLSVLLFCDLLCECKYISTVQSIDASCMHIFEKFIIAADELKYDVQRFIRKLQLVDMHMNIRNRHSNPNFSDKHYHAIRRKHIPNLELLESKFDMQRRYHEILHPAGCQECPYKVLSNEYGNTWVFFNVLNARCLQDGIVAENIFIQDRNGDCTVPDNTLIASADGDDHYHDALLHARNVRHKIGHTVLVVTKTKCAAVVVIYTKDGKFCDGYITFREASLVGKLYKFVASAVSYIVSEVPLPVFTALGRYISA